MVRFVPRARPRPLARLICAHLAGRLCHVAGHECVCVNWPDPYVCHQSKWMPFVRDELKADEATVLVGHSTGALLAWVPLLLAPARALSV